MLLRSSFTGRLARMGPPSAATYQQAEHLILQRAQTDCFPDDYALLRAGKPVSANSRLITLSPEFDKESGLIKVGGRLRRAEELDPAAVHSSVQSGCSGSAPPSYNAADQRL